MHKVLVNRLGGLSLSRKSVVSLTDRPEMTSAVYRGRKTKKQQQCYPLDVIQCVRLSYGGNNRYILAVFLYGSAFLNVTNHSFSFKLT